eukprot:gnl/TRDRNA2_/TRDRNA2_193547_c0_seq1.p1 gnl/TRDRNA2_/TRDRNA2_193547_c0~~gnl/TRDRNA2_/TRDRNA2_193547_c0_seq1.p1  ORF type:complete len:182 (-),score=32.54 gnl/TRDRNA2_/TRDRNA2_193547_c0_seq1:42-587(-)
MVKILASGEIVQDNDPRVKAAAAPKPAPARPSGPGGLAGMSASSGSNGGPSQRGSGASGAAGLPPGGEEENVLKGDLARMLGIHGQTQNLFGRELPLVYLIVGGILAFLWVTQQYNAIKMLVFGFILYTTYTTYQKANASGASLSFGGGFGGGAPGGSGGPGGRAPEDNSSGGHVIKRPGK